jgi:glycosyltransferase involved in cell wall biosynthesis
MRILQLAPLWETVPPPAYGGTEAVVSLLTEQLVARGHEVILAASGDSKTAARLLSVYPRSLRRADDLKDRVPYDWLHIGAALAAARDVDVVHNHAGELAMAMAGAIDTPMLTTAHCLPTEDTRHIWERYHGAWNTISRSQKRTVADVRVPGRFVGHVYNAIDVETFPFEAKKGDDLLFLSRIAPEKGPQHAIAVAKKLGMRLILAGKVDRYDQRFFDEVVQDLIDGEQIVFVGEADAQQKRELYAKAKCLLMPLCWEEPFGLVMPEAMACGTPVIAFRRGSAPELIAHGETGFIVDTVDEMAEAVQDVGRIDAARCRAHVQAHFSPESMTDAYLDVYADLLDRPRWPHSVVVPAPLAAAPVDVPVAAGERREPDGEAAPAIAVA